MQTPQFMYGTAWKEDTTARCVTDEIAAGFRAIDTANQRKHYHEVGVGDALKQAYEAGTVKRADLFLQTKFTSLGGQDQRLPYDPDAPLSKQVEQSFESSLNHLHTDYLDSYVLHGPTTGYGLTPDDWEIWHAMEKIHASGRSKVLGVSNVDLKQLQMLVAEAKVKPSFVQNRCYARAGWDQQIRDFCSQHKIVYQGFSLLTANRQIFQDPHFGDIVRQVKCTPAQAVFKFAMDVGMLPLTGTTSPVHMREDLECINVQLSKDQVRAIEQLLLR